MSENAKEEEPPREDEPFDYKAKPNKFYMEVETDGSLGPQEVIFRVRPVALHPDWTRLTFLVHRVFKSCRPKSLISSLPLLPTKKRSLMIHPFLNPHHQPPVHHPRRHGSDREDQADGAAPLDQLEGGVRAAGLLHGATQLTRVAQRQRGVADRQPRMRAAGETRTQQAQDGGALLRHKRLAGEVLHSRQTVGMYNVFLLTMVLAVICIFTSAAQ